MSSVVLNGDSSGSVTLTVPSAAGSNTATVPAQTGTLEMLGQGTAVNASGTSIDFTGIPSWVKRITVMFNGVSTNGTSNIIIQLGDNGGIETTGYLGSTSGATTGVSTVTFTTGFGVCVVITAASILNGVASISLLDSSTNTWAFGATTGLSNLTQSHFGGGAKPLSAKLDRIRITTVNGTDTFDAGSINILYEG